MISVIVEWGIQYIYAPDGTRLRTVHKVSGFGGTVTRDTTDYYGNLVLRNGHLSIYRFDGGYVSFSNDTIDGWHYYIQDYMGNNRMVVNSDGTIEQVTHYYPYGGVIGDISTNENVQKYKFEGKELDRTFGLDNYDIHARQYFAMAPMWDRIDPMAEKYYGISPYAYCGGDPVNLGDYDGESLYGISSDGYLHLIEKNNDEFHTLRLDSNHSKSWSFQNKKMIEDFAIKKIKGKEEDVNVKRAGGIDCHVTITDDPEILRLFNVLVHNTKVEYGLMAFDNGESTQYLLGTSHTEAESQNYYEDAEVAKFVSEEDTIWRVHTHPGENGTKGGSGYDFSKPTGDLRCWLILNSKFKREYKKPMPKMYVYHPFSQQLYQFNGKKNNILVPGGIFSLFK